MTNITVQHRRAFKALTSGTHENFALFSCFVRGAPALAAPPIRRLLELAVQ